MKAIILAAGYATRLYPLTKNIPKALLPLQDKTILDRIMEKLEGLRLKRVYLVTNHKFYAQFSAWAKGKEIAIFDDRTNSEENRRGAVGDILFAMKEANIRDDLLVVNGDNLFEFDLKHFLHFFKERPKIACLDIKDKEKAKQYGVVAVEDQKIVRFEEKPQHPFSTLISTGVYFFPKKNLHLVKAYVEQGGKTDRTGDFIEWLVKQTTVYAYPAKGKWFDIGTKEILEEARKEFS